MADQKMVINIDGNIQAIESKLKSLKQTIDTTMNPDKAKHFSTAFEGISKLLDKIKASSSGTVNSNSMFSSMSKDSVKAQQMLQTLLRQLDDLAKLSDSEKISFLPANEQQKIAEIVQVINAFADGLVRAQQKSQGLVEAEKELAQATDKHNKAIEKQKAAQSGYDAALQKQREQNEALVKLQEEQAALNKNEHRTDAETAELAQYQSKIDDATNSLRILKKEVNKHESAVASANKNVSDTSSILDSTTKRVNELNAAFKDNAALLTQQAYDKLRESAKQCGIDISQIPLEYSEASAESLTTALEKLSRKGIEKFDKNLVKANHHVNESASDFNHLKESVDKAGKQYKEMEQDSRALENMESRMKRFLGLSGAAIILRKSIRDAINTIKELDAVMGEMAVVTDLDVGDYWAQLPDYTKRASELGVSIHGAYEAATLYYQQGLKTNEVIEVSNETLKMAKIAGMNAAEATDKMTAALRGFNMEIDETNARRINDVYSELAAITASDTKEISTAMTKTASIAHSANMEFETTAAFLSQIIETTRESAETAGTAMKTVIARFQELQKDPSKIGNVDGEIVDANKIETALRSVGVALRDETGQFRALDDVFLELASKWDSLETNTQRYIATIAAGSRQQSRFIAMMSNYKRTIELVDAANNSAGASQRQFDKTLETMETKINQLRNAWNNFTMGILNNEFIKAGIDLLTKFFTVLNKITDGFQGLTKGWNGLIGSISKISIIYALTKTGKILFTKFAVPLLAKFRNLGQQSAQQFSEGVDSVTNPSATTPAKVVPGSSNDIARASMTWKEKLNPKTAFKNMGAKISEPWKAAKQSFDTSAGLKAKNKNLVNEYKANQDVLKAQQAELMEQQKKMAELEKLKNTRHKNNAKLTNQETVQKMQLQNTINKQQKKIAASQAEQDELSKQYAENEEARLDARAKAWDKVSSGITAMGGAVMGVGMAFGLVGNLLDEMGLTEVADVLNDIGQALMLVGTALMAIPPLMKLIQAAQAGDPIYLTLMLILTALVAIATVISSIVKKHSRKNIMKNLIKETERAKKAAEDAKAAYTELADSYGEYNKLVNTLNDLTEGTQAWKEQLVKVNQQVLELLDKYPGLEATMLNNGQLVITDESWKTELRAMEQRMNISRIQVINAKNREIEQQLAWIDEDFQKNKIDQRSRDTQEQQLKTKQSGLYESAFLTTTGEKTNVATSQFFSQYLKNTSLNGIDGAHVAQEKTNTMMKSMKAQDWKRFAILGGIPGLIWAFAGNSKDEDMNKLAQQYQIGGKVKDARKQAREIWKKQRNGTDEDLKNMTDEEIVRDVYEFEQAKQLETGNQKLNDLISKQGNESDKRKMAGYFANGSALLSASDLSQYYSEITQDKGFSALGGKTIEALAEDLGLDAETLRNLIEDNMRATQEQFLTLPTILQSSAFGSVNIDTLSKLQTKLMGASGDQWTNITDHLQLIIEDQDDMTKTLILEAMSNIDWTSKQGLLQMEDIFEDYGIDTSKLGTDIESLRQAIIDGTGALNKLDPKKAAGQIFSTQTLISGLKSGEHGTTFTADEYNTLMQLIPEDELRKSFTKRGDQYYLTGKSMTAFIDYVTKEITGDGVRQSLTDMQAGINKGINARNKANETGNLSQEALADPSTATDDDLKAYVSTLFANLGDDENVWRQIGLSEFIDRDVAGLKNGELQRIVKKIMGLEVVSDDDINNAVTETLGLQTAAQNANIYKDTNTTEEQRKSALDAIINQAITSGIVPTELIAQLQDTTADGFSDALDAVVAILGLQEDSLKVTSSELELRQQSLEEYEKSRNEEIDELEKINQQIYDTKTKILDGIEKEISRRRQERTNAKTEQSIAEMVNKLAILRLNSGANENEILKLEEEIADAQLDYSDSLIDQKISDIRDKMQDAQEELQTQTDLMRKSLELSLLNNTVNKDLSADFQTMIQGYRAGGRDNTDFKTKFKSLYGYDLDNINDADWPAVMHLLGLIASVANTKKFATGGLADFTGPAWLDGTKTSPELVLNQQDTKNFLTLKDVLSSVMRGGAQAGGAQGDNYFDIAINVDSIENGYDVEQMAKKVKDMIYSNAQYRNVNAIEKTR